MFKLLEKCVKVKVCRSEEKEWYNTHFVFVIKWSICICVL